MKCDECGQILDEDDEIDRSSTRPGRTVKALCSNCGHIQYGTWSADDDASLDGEESIDDIENDWWPGYLDEDDSD